MTMTTDQRWRRCGPASRRGWCAPAPETLGDTGRGQVCPLADPEQLLDMSEAGGLLGREQATFPLAPWCRTVRDNGEGPGGPW